MSASPRIWLVTSVFRGRSALPKLHARKSGVDQTVPSATETVVTFPSQLFAGARYFDTTNNRWSPPKGVYHLIAHVTITGGAVDQAQEVLAIRRNGTAIARTYHTPSGTGGHTIECNIITDVAPGDYFDVTVNLAGAGDKTIGSNLTFTYFEAFAI